jgi:hypothetical protein
VLKLMAAPNPQGGSSLNLAFELEGDADGMAIEIYTKAMTLISRIEISGTFVAGWNSLNCPAHGLANGLYYVVLTGMSQGESYRCANAAKVYRLD